MYIVRYIEMNDIGDDDLMYIARCRAFDMMMVSCLFSFMIRS